jgi:hypothetical protein
MDTTQRWQFSLRDVLLLMLIVGLGIGWLVDHRRMADEVAALRQKMVWQPRTPYVPGAPAIPTSPAPPSTDYGHGSYHIPNVLPPGESLGHIPNALPPGERLGYIPNALAPIEKLPPARGSDTPSEPQ